MQRLLHRTKRLYSKSNRHPSLKETTHKQMRITRRPRKSSLTHKPTRHNTRCRILRSRHHRLIRALCNSQSNRYHTRVHTYNHRSQCRAGLNSQANIIHPHLSLFLNHTIIKQHSFRPRSRQINHATQDLSSSYARDLNVHPSQSQRQPNYQGYKRSQCKWVLNSHKYHRRTRNQVHTVSMYNTRKQQQLSSGNQENTYYHQDRNQQRPTTS